MQIITENKIKVKATKAKKDVDAKMPVFYNPLMKSNRNISVVLLNSLNKKKMNMALPLAGSGIRGLRFLQELGKNKINQLFVNDKKENFVKLFEENLDLNNLKDDKVTICNEEANQFLLNLVDQKDKPKDFCGYFDYIDIDPFGTPNPFLSAAIARISRNGIIALTATDTAALTGTYPKVTKRKYWARNVRNYLMHETGLRILIRKVQLLGVQFDKALIPILSYHKDHYFRIYFQSIKSKEKCDEILDKQKYLLFCPNCLEFKLSIFNNEQCACGKKFDFFGPMWCGGLFDKKLIRKISKENKFDEEQKFLDVLAEEAKKDVVGFYDLHVLAKKYKLEAKKIDLFLKKLKAVRTHFSLTGIKTEKKIKEIIKLLKQ